MGILDEATQKAALLAKDAVLRRNAIRALGSNAAASTLFFGAGVISDPDVTAARLAAPAKLAEFPTTPEIQTVTRSLATDATLKADEWLAEATKLLTKKHKVEVFKEGPNLLPNPGFEIVTAEGLPEGWTRRDYGKKPGNEKAEWTVVSVDGKTPSGKNAVRVITRDDADTSFHADAALKPHTQYRLSGWVKAHGVKERASTITSAVRRRTRFRGKPTGWKSKPPSTAARTRRRASIFSTWRRATVFGTT